MLENLALALIGGLAGLGLWTLVEPLVRMWMAKRHTGLFESKNLLDSVSHSTSDIGHVNGYVVRAIHGFSAYGVYSVGHTLAIYPEKSEHKFEYPTQAESRTWKGHKHPVIYSIDTELREVTLAELPKAIADFVAPMVGKNRKHHTWFDKILFAR
jgi:hypothetical protein